MQNQDLRCGVNTVHSGKFAITVNINCSQTSTLDKLIYIRVWRNALAWNLSQICCKETVSSGDLSVIYSKIIEGNGLCYRVTVGNFDIDDSKDNVS